VAKMRRQRGLFRTLDHRSRELYNVPVYVNKCIFTRMSEYISLHSVEKQGVHGSLGARSFQGAARGAGNSN
jgi:hypothetical protein